MILPIYYSYQNLGIILIYYSKRLVITKKTGHLFKFNQKDWSSFKSGRGKICLICLVRNFCLKFITEIKLNTKLIKRMKIWDAEAFFV